MEEHMVYILWVIFAILLADLISGIFHWWEDRYGNPNWPIIGKYIVEPNINQFIFINIIFSCFIGHYFPLVIK